MDYLSWGVTATNVKADTVSGDQTANTAVKDVQTTAVNQKDNNSGLCQLVLVRTYDHSQTRVAFSFLKKTVNSFEKICHISKTIAMAF